MCTYTKHGDKNKHRNTQKHTESNVKRLHTTTYLVSFFVRLNKQVVVIGKQLFMLSM